MRDNNIFFKSRLVNFSYKLRVPVVMVISFQISMVNDFVISTALECRSINQKRRYGKINNLIDKHNIKIGDI